MVYDVCVNSHVKMFRACQFSKLNIVNVVGLIIDCNVKLGDAVVGNVELAETFREGVSGEGRENHGAHPDGGAVGHEQDVSRLFLLAQLLAGVVHSVQDEVFYSQEQILIPLHSSRLYFCFHIIIVNVIS